MTFETFKSSLDQDQAPAGIQPLLVALWHDARGDWERAHNIAQDVHSNDGSWVHAYLHRKEGDQWNAGYWYRRAGHKMPKTTLDEEWKDIVRALLKDL